MSFLRYFNLCDMQMHSNCLARQHAKHLRFLKLRIDFCHISMSFFYFSMWFFQCVTQGRIVQIGERFRIRPDPCKRSLNRQYRTVNRTSTLVSKLRSKLIYCTPSSSVYIYKVIRI